MEIKLRTIAIGDIHGCIDEFNDLLNKISYNPEKDRIILLGDLIDRGSDSVGVIRKAREMNLECVMGNHEYSFLKWHRSNKKVYSDKSFYQNLSDEDITYIANMPSYIKLNNNFVALHAGLRPDLDLDQQRKNDFLYLRYTDINGNFVSLTEICKLGIKGANAHFWTEFWKGPYSIVYGHNVHSFKDPLIENISKDVSCYGLDTGCCFGGRLTAMILETKEIIQVQARETYYKSMMEL